MKWVAFTISVLFFAGCTSLSERDESYYVTGFDFTPFVEKGFYYSPNTYNGKYITMGTLDILFLSETKFTDIAEYKSPPLTVGLFI